MCMVCAEWSKGKMTINEALRAIGEMAENNDPDHVYYLMRELAESQDDE